MRRFELIEGTSAKFWQVEVSGNDVTTQWGRIGTAGQAKTKTFASPAAAQAEHDALVREKTGKGYKETGGSAGAAPPPPPAVSAPVSSPPAVEEPVAVASVPAPPAPAAPVLSPPDAGPEALWTPEMRRRLHPRRTSGTPRVSLSAAEAFAVMRAHFQRHAAPWASAASRSEPSIGQQIAAVAARLGGEDGGVPALASAQIEGTALAMLSYRKDWSMTPVHGQVVKYWAATAGTTFAIEALVAAALYVVPRIPNHADLVLVAAAADTQAGMSVTASLGDGRIGPWLMLRRILASVPLEEWESARQTAERLRAGATPAVRCALAYLFPDQPAWAVEEAQKILATGVLLPPYGCLLLATLQDGELLDRLVASSPNGHHLFPHLDFWNEDALGTTLSMAEGAGAGAVPALVRLLGVRTSADFVRDCALALSVVPSTEALTLLISRLDVKEISPAASRAVAAAPRRALPILAAQAGRGAAGQLAEALLTQIVRSDEALMSELLPELPEASRRAVETALQRSAPAAPDAPAESLPPVLARPPWLEKKVRREEGVLSLIPRNEPDGMVWPPGLRESWLAAEIPKWATVFANAGRDGAALAVARLPPLPAGALADPVELRRFLESQASTTGGERGVVAMNLASEPLALALWETVPLSSWFSQRMLDRFVATYELRALPGLVRHAAASFGTMAEIVLPFRAGALAPSAADALVR
ncbi:MAG TPA: WGR domain-containing protein, partial [Thermoanaerobaculia bacterium]